MAKSVANVSGNTVAVVLGCTGDGPCSGSANLLVTITSKHSVRRHGTRATVRRTRSIVIGQGRFSIAANGSVTIHERLTRQGAALLRRAGKRGLKVTVTGVGVQSRTLVLRRAHTARHHGKRRG